MDEEGREQHLISERIFSSWFDSRSMSRVTEARCSSWLLETSLRNPAMRASCSSTACSK